MSKLATMSFAFAQTCSPSSWRPTRRTLARFATPIATHLSAGRESYLRPNCHSIWLNHSGSKQYCCKQQSADQYETLDRNLDFAHRTNLIQVRAFENSHAEIRNNDN